MSKLSIEIFQSIKTYRCINPTYKATGRKAGESPVYPCLPPCYYHNRDHRRSQTSPLDYAKLWWFHGLDWGGGIVILV